MWTLTFSVAPCACRRCVCNDIEMLGERPTGSIVRQGDARERQKEREGREEGHGGEKERNMKRRRSWMEGFWCCLAILQMSVLEDDICVKSPSEGGSVGGGMTCSVVVTSTGEQRDLRTL